MVVKLPPPEEQGEEHQKYDRTPKKSDFDPKQAEMSPLTSTPIPRKSHPKVFSSRSVDDRPRAPIDLQPRVRTHISRRGSVDMIFNYE
jgi:hypothetical protein